MFRRVVPPVLSSISPLALLAAAGNAARGTSGALRVLHDVLLEHYRADSVLLTDSGTSALVMALRALVGNSGTVAYPGYACVDLAAAAVFAGVNVRLYDLDPVTLSPDLDSVQRAVDRGVSAVVVVHFFGYPADVSGVARIARSVGATVIEDAAQGAGGRIGSDWLGSAGDATVLSFGRGKGTTGGGGGALLLRGNASREHALTNNPLPSAWAGWRPLATSAAQLLLGNPTLYAIPSAIPQLKLGEMVYHPAHEPIGISSASARLVVSAIERTAHDVAVRTEHAQSLEHACTANGTVHSISLLPKACPGYLRFPLRLSPRYSRALPMELGVVRPYPRSLHDQPELSSALLANEPPTPGAAELASHLVTLPTHAQVASSDMHRLTSWIQSINDSA